MPQKILLANSGQVTKDEFLTKMNDLNSNLDETDKIQDVFKQVDRDGDGEISFMEFFTKLPTIMGRVNQGQYFNRFFYR